MLSRFLPKSVPFFMLLEQQSASLNKQSLLLLSLIEQTDKPSLEDFNTISQLKDFVCSTNKKIFEHLLKTFITPIDKEDLHDLSLSQEQISIIQCEIAYFLQCFPHVKTLHIKELLEQSQKIIEIKTSIISGLPSKKDTSVPLCTAKNHIIQAKEIVLVAYTEIGLKHHTLQPDILNNLIPLTKIYDYVNTLLMHLLSLINTLEKVLIKYV